MKFKLLSAVAVLMVLVCLLAGTVYAWISFGDSTAPMVFKIAKIDSTITLSKFRDDNYNGFPNLDENNRPVLEEIGTQAALEEEFAEINMTMEILDMLPTQVHMYRVFIVNNSEADNDIRITFTGYDTADYADGSGNPLYTGEDFDNFINCLKIMSVTVVRVTEDGLDFSGGEKHFFANAVFGSDSVNPDNRPLNFTVVSDIKIGNILVPTLSNEVTLVLKFEFETLETLNKPVDEGGAGLNMTQAEYQSYQGRSFKLPIMSVYLEITAK